ncbi:glycoside hydrolase family 38 C-terminal domain-containing protein [uncultured Thomasclavelia sp.]|uniref:glycoside hydrolase family 38 N-terminal domain-containing protein n=1 Tax=uncultured Thomasclavelia sp. TaxID=3025759 RepID=UPI002598C9D2|nr:glycoside hydrolase family 38 C-terminal domain-containing protein [uncultured Thomasclavelia sp.]
MKHKKLKKGLTTILTVSMAAGLVTPINVHAATYDDHTMYMVGNAHIDTAWQWPYEDTARDVIKDTLQREIKALNENPNHKFTMSATKHYEWAKEYYPEMYEEIKKFMKNGQWDNPGGQVVEPDLNIPSGESLVRQSLEGQHFFEKEFGKTSTVGYVPDTFGFSGQFPQILKKSGMDSFVTTKLNWQNDGNNGKARRKSDVFKWNGIDGKSQVLSYAPHLDYVSDYNDNAIKEAFDRNKQSGYETNVKIALGMFGGGDHGGGPDGNGYNRYDGKTVDGAEVKLATISEFFDDLEKQDLTNVREVDGEMYFENHRGTYTSWGQVKKYNRKNEILAEQAEKATTIGNWLNAMPDADTANLYKAWDRILVNQFHDVLPGSGIPYAYMDTYNDQELAERLMENTLNSGVNSMAYVADTQVDGTPVIVFNALSWARDEMVEVDVKFDNSIPEKVAVYDGQEKLLGTVISRDDENNTATIRFQAKNIPAVGYKVFSVSEDKGENVTSSLSVADAGNIVTMENENLKVEVDKTTGNIRQIYNKKDGNRPAFVEGTGSELHVLTDTGSNSYAAWDVTKDQMNAAPIGILNEAQSVEIVDQSAERVVVRVSKKWRNSTIKQDMILDADSDKVDVDMAVDWKEDQQMLKIAFPIAADADMADYEMAYGSLQRPTTRDTVDDSLKFEVSGHKWADITDNDGSHGVSILNDSKYGWDALKQDDGSTRLRLSALRSPMGADVRCSGWGDNYIIEKTQHEFSYSVYPHANDWRSADTVHKGYEFNYESAAKQALKHEGALASNHSFASAQSDDNNVQLTVMKTPQDEAGVKNKLVLRTYESEGKDGSKVTLTLPSNVVSAKEVNLLEHDDDKLNKNIEINGNKISYTVDKYEITTIEVTLDESGLEQAELSSKAADLSSFYNIDGTSSDENRKEGDFDGKGNTIPEALWEPTITYNGAEFKMGSGTGEDKNFVQAKGQRISLPEGKYDAIYILGSAAGNGATSGEFTVYQDGEEVKKELSFADWQANLSGWDRFTNMFASAEVKDQIAHVFTHFHNGTVDRMTVDNYQYIYKIPVNNEKELESILLPEAEGIKIAAITAVRSDLLANSFEYDETNLKNPITNLQAEEVKDAINTVSVTWDVPEGVEKVRIYRGETADFEANAESCVGISLAGENRYIDKIDGQGYYFYKAVGVDAKGNETPVSQASNGLFAGSTNISLQVPKENITANHFMNDSEAPYKAADGANDTKWCGEDTSTSHQPTWLKMDLGENSYDVKGFTVYSAGNEKSDYIAKNFSVQGSNDGETWTDIVTVKDNDIRERDITLDKTVNYRYYRLWLTEAVQDDNPKNTARIYEFKIWGQKDEVKVPTVKDVAITAFVSEENSNESVYQASYRFVPMSDEDSDSKTKVEWFKTVNGEKTPIDKTGKTITLANEEAFTWESLSVRVTPMAADGTEGTPVESSFMLSSNDRLDDKGNIENNILSNKPVSANQQVNENESGAKMVDDSFVSKWCAEHINEQNPGEAVIDMRGTYELSKLQLFHATYAHDNEISGADGRDKDKNWNTRTYQVYISDDGESWKEIATYDKDDGSSKSEHVLDPSVAKGRYLKLVVTQPVHYDEQGNPVDVNCAMRINEIKAAGKLISLLPGEKEEDPVIYNVKVNPAQAEMKKGTTLNFRALVEGTYNPSQDVEWSVEGAKNAETVIDASGKLTVSLDESANELIVRATSLQDRTQSGTATVKLESGIAVDKSNLTQAVEEAKKLNKDDYTEESWAKFAEALANAETVLADENVNQADVDNVVKLLQAAKDALVKVVDSDKTALKIAIELANAITEDDLKNVIPVVANEFKAARDEANAVYNNASATQDEVNVAFDRLASAMQKLEFYVGDKTALKAFIDKVSDLDSTKYTETTWTQFNDALTAANGVYNDVNAMQPEVNEAYTNLVTAFLNLRLIPDKSLLEDLINQAEGLNSANYTKASFDGLTKALDEAKVVFENPNATQEEVDSAKATLEKAINSLEVNTTTPVDNTAKTPVDNGDTTTNVKTGDDALVGTLAGLALLSIAGAKVLRKKENN